VPDTAGVLERDSADLPGCHERQNIMFAFYSPVPESLLPLPNDIVRRFVFAQANELHPPLRPG
jgi:hypothetical protein